MTLITYQRQIVEVLPDGDSLKTFVCFLALYARDVHTGTLPGDPYRYLPWRGECYARAALMPTREFRSLQHRFDHDLADPSRVPLGQTAGSRGNPPAGRPRSPTEP